MAASGDHLLFDACNGACQAAQPDGWGGSRAKNGVPGLSDGSVMLVVHRLQLLLVEGRSGTVRAKHERSRLGLVTRLKTLVPCQTHQEAWLERSKHWLGWQGRALSSECTKTVNNSVNDEYVPIPSRC